MTFIQTHWRAFVSVLVLAVVIVAGAFYYKHRVPAFPLSQEDHLTSWVLTSTYSPDAVAKTTADIAHLQSLMGKGEYDDYDLYIGMALDYQHLGDGAKAYAQYNHAIKIHPAKGLAYVDIGSLMEQLKAYATARDAYAKAVAVEPGQLAYQTARITYLTGRFPTDSALITAALTDASKVFGDNDGILAIEAQWLTSVGRYADAIKAWKVIRVISPKSRWPAIDLELARLQSKI